MFIVFILILILILCSFSFKKGSYDLSTQSTIKAKDVIFEKFSELQQELKELKIYDYSFN